MRHSKEEKPAKILKKVKKILAIYTESYIINLLYNKSNIFLTKISFLKQIRKVREE